MIDRERGQRDGLRTPRDGKIDQRINQAVSDVSEVLRDLDGVQRRATQSGQNVFAGAANLGSQIARLQRTNGIHDPRVLYNMLFEAGVPAGALQSLGARITKKGWPEEQHFSEGYIKDEFFGDKLVGQVDLPSRSGGDKWLTDLLNDQRAHKRFSLRDACRVQMLGRAVSFAGTDPHYGSRAAAITRLMFMCGSEEPDGEQGAQ